MQYLGIRQSEKVVTVYYRATWDYDYGYMLLFFQQLLDEDFLENITHAEAGDYDSSDSFLEELLRVRGSLRHCRALLSEKSFISLAGYSKSMECDVRITLWSGTNHVQLEVQETKDMFREHGNHVFDVYMDSFEILAYIAAARAGGGP